jgi:hypothetical protein
MVLDILIQVLLIIIYRCAATSFISNDTFTILIDDVSKERYELPENDMQCAIETCRRILSVLV